MANIASNFFLNIVTSGKHFNFKKEEEMDMAIHYILLNAMIFLGSTLLVTFGIQSLRVGASLQAIFDFTMAGFTILSFILLRVQDNYTISSTIAVIPVAFLYGWLAQNGGVQGSGVLWSYSYPLLAIFLLGRFWGGTFSALLLISMSIFLFVPGASAYQYELSFALRTVGVYILVLICALVYEQTKFAKDIWVQSLTKALQGERDEMAAMKDNIQDGLFLLDGSFQIQPQYSKSLQSILDIDELAGLSFLTILSSSVAEQDMPTLRDYLEMVHKRQFDTAMLDDINPLRELTYQSPQGKEKFLSCSFTAVNRSDGSTFILVTIRDKTRAVELQRQLDSEESKRQDEMRALFEVIHVEPRVLNDFIEDTEAEFARINEVLKDKDRPSDSIIVDLYQSIHAIKSNSVILGLDSLGNKLHKFEQELTLLRRAHEVTFQDMLHIAVEIEDLQREKDHVKELIKKIVSFKFGEGRMQEHYVLIRTLERVVERVSMDLNRRVKLVVKALEPETLLLCDRRAIKDILVQLLRNAMYHGIEPGEARLALGKPEQGRLSVSLERDGNRVVLTLADDGRGLDFEAIRRKGLESGLIDSSVDISDHSALLQLLFNPGFSTRDSADLHAGRGMGLSMVRDKVKDLRGSVKIQSEAGKGTTFRIHLPLSEHEGKTQNISGQAESKLAG